MEHDERQVMHPSVEHPVALVLGSGLGQLSGLVKPVRRIPYREMEGFPASARPVGGHSFEATVGTLAGVPVVVYPGRVHLYQGYSAHEVSAQVRHARKLGCTTVVFACAVGAVRPEIGLGLGLVSDHINLTGANPLVARNAQAPDGYGDEGFAHMADVYTPCLRDRARAIAREIGVELSEGVLAGVLGPSFETPAEVAALSALGVSYVGMSVVCEAIEAHAAGMQVLALPLVTNRAGAAGVSHQTVLAEAGRHADEFERLVCGILASLF